MNLIELYDFVFFYIKEILIFSKQRLSLKQRCARYLIVDDTEKSSHVVQLLHRQIPIKTLFLK